MLHCCCGHADLAQQRIASHLVLDVYALKLLDKYHRHKIGKMLCGCKARGEDILWNSRSILSAHLEVLRVSSGQEEDILHVTEGFFKDLQTLLQQSKPAQTLETICTVQ